MTGFASISSAIFARRSFSAAGFGDGRVAEVDLDQLADADAADAVEAELVERALHGVALGIEDLGLQADENGGLAHVETPRFFAMRGSGDSVFGSNVSPVMRSNAST